MALSTVQYYNLHLTRLEKKVHYTAHIRIYCSSFIILCEVLNNIYFKRSNRLERIPKLNQETGILCSNVNGWRPLVAALKQNEVNIEWFINSFPLDGGKRTRLQMKSK